MYRRNIAELNNLGKEIIYIDQLTQEKRSGIVMYVEEVDPNTYFAYIASPYKDENIHEDFGFKYRDIVVFDNIPNTIEGWDRDLMQGELSRIKNKKKK